jgi:drug/metabolite transporter (DMT)-like permease
MPPSGVSTARRWPASAARASTRRSRRVCLLATPLLGIFSATLILGKSLEPSLFLAMTLIIGGIALGTVTGSLRAKAA